MATKKSPLHECHLKAKAKMVPFAGFKMPLSYTGGIKEHEAVRTKAGMFDVSHMGEVIAKGPQALDFVQNLVTNNAAKLYPGKAMYTAMCYPNGTVVDDLIVLRRAEDEFMLIINAACTEKDFQWMKDNHNHDCSLDNISDALALIAVQGPNAIGIVSKVFRDVELAELKRFHALDTAFQDDPVIISRTGYTGEDGVEIYIQSEKGPGLWDALLETGTPQGLLLCGLGARDSLRLEAGMLLYGNDMDDTTTAIEAGLGWVVKAKKGDFIGRDVLVKQKKEGTKRKLIGFTVATRGIPRQHYTLLSSNHEIGEVTSGIFSPSLKQGIGMGYVQSDFTEPGTTIQVDIRGKLFDAEVVSLPFIKSK